MPSRRSRRHLPYNLDDPANWTVNKLKTELEVLGIKLTSTMPKSSLIQLYQQLCKAKNGSEPPSMNANTNDTMNTQSDFPRTLGIENNNQSSVVTEISTNMPTLNSNAVSGDNLVPGTVGVITAMQSTISSLQATISNLLTEKSTEKGNNVVGTAPKNLLEQYYGTQIAETTTNQATSTQFGVSADDLPHVDVVSESVRRKIVEGKYINLACLLIPEFEAPNITTNEMSGIEFLRQGRKDHRLDRVLTITQFYKAFGIYKRIMCEVYPQRRLELDLYEADIGTIFEHYGEIFYQYHCQFTRKAAAYLEKGIKIDWSKRNKDLFQLVVGGVKTRVCDYCNQSDHQSPFCPTQYNVQCPIFNQKRQQELRERYPDSKFDKRGRIRLDHQGKEICNNFNSSICRTPPGICKFAHVCKKCKSESHGESNCDSQKMSINKQIIPNGEQGVKQTPSA